MKPEPLSLHIQLTKEESFLFSVLKECSKKINGSAIIRIAGGWVRDKLLRQSCNDIDIVVDVISGQTLAKAFQEHLLERGLHPSRVCVIKDNPDKSKHLQTSTFRVGELSLDFARLRNELYSKYSRIPSVTNGSPLDDAYRRDTTINSLFYNIMQGVVEDFTSFGIHDLTHGVLRTPLQPVETFLDDPLRILRIMRFAARFSYTVQPEIIEACKLPEVRESFRLKVSRERVKIEIDKTFHRSGISTFVKLMLASEFWPLIMEKETAEVNMVVRVYRVYYGLRRLWEETGDSFCSEETRLEENYLLLLFPVIDKPPTSSAQRTHSSLALEIFKNSLKGTNKEYRAIKSIITGHYGFTKLLKGAELSRRRVGRAVREAQGLYLQSLLLGMVHVALDMVQDWPDNTGDVLSLSPSLLTSLRPVVERARTIRTFITDSDLHTAHLIHTVLDAAEIEEILRSENIDSPKPKITSAREFLCDCQFQTPHISKIDAQTKVREYITKAYK